MRFPRTLLCLALALLFCGSVPSHAQKQESSMSEAEVDQLRESAYVPPDRVNTFIKILDARARRIQEIVSKPRHAGRESQLHDLFDQMADIAGELNDNLDEYAPKHRDLRKALPKLIDAAERWSTTLRSAAPDPAYKVVQKIALDAVRDVHDAAAALQTEQLAYFKAHPEAAKAEKDRTSGEPTAIEVPR